MELAVPNSYTGMVRGVFPMIIIIIVMGCSSHRYGAHFNDYSKVNSASSSQLVTSINRITENPVKGKDEPPVVASMRSEGNLLTEQNVPLNLVNPALKESKHTFTLRKPEIKSIKQELKKRVLNYKRTSKPDSVESIKEMPRYKYLFWAGILALVGIVLVAFSISSGAMGVLATVAFTGALVFFVFWILKK